jgi:hypothetical protein
LYATARLLLPLLPLPAAVTHLQLSLHHHTLAAAAAAAALEDWVCVTHHIFHHSWAPQQRGTVGVGQGADAPWS